MEEILTSVMPLMVFSSLYNRRYEHYIDGNRIVPATFHSLVCIHGEYLITVMHSTVSYNILMSEYIGTVGIQTITISKIWLQIFSSELSLNLTYRST